MRLPIIPFLVAVSLLTGVVYLFNSSSAGERVLDIPKLTRLADIPGIETEVAAAPDGNRYAIVSSGDVWLLNMATGEQKQLTHTPEPEMFPAWAPDGTKITFTRGADTFVVHAESALEELFRANATWLSWSLTSRTVFVRDRALWVANPNDQNEQELVEADAIPDVTIQTPRFSPNALQVAFIKSQLGLRGELWLLDAVNGMARPLVADRVAENPIDLAWFNEGRNIAYLTNRAGAYSLWHIDLAESTILPLTPPLVAVPLSRIGIGISKDRIVVPRHLVDSDIVVSDGTTVAKSEKLEFEPAASRDGKFVAYTIAQENRFEIWTAGIGGDSPTFRALGREPRFAPNGYELVYSHIDLSGNADIWKIDTRNGSAERVTDADEIDVAGDWSPNGRSITFASGRAGAISIWTIPASGGKRLRITEAGYAPRFAPDNRSILFWNLQTGWIMDSDGTNLQQAQTGLTTPSSGIWSPKGPAFLVNGEIRTARETLYAVKDRLIWPQLDILPDGRFVVAPVDIRDAGLWAVDLTYREN